MKWLVIVQAKVDKPAECVEVKTFVVKAETEAGASAVIESYHPSYMIRGVVKLGEAGK